jgi:release factor glutamine methyltransferase
VAVRIWTPLELVRWTADYLAGRGIGESRLNAELLLAGVLGVRRLDLYLQHDRPLTPEELAAFKERLKRRLRHEPLQYIEGAAAFRNLVLRVDRRALIPRPETELLVGEVLAWARGRQGLCAADVGTGSGAIALSLAVEGPFAHIVATDASADALALAAENRDFAAPGARVDFRLGRSYDPVAGERFDVVVSNPPYVAEAERPILPPEVREWEPPQALFAGQDGLGVLRELVAGAPAHLEPGGLLALEIGEGQADAVMALLRDQRGLEAPRVVQDLAGRDRIVLARAAPGAPPVEP